jgi:phage-related minor tail protein
MADNIPDTAGDGAGALPDVLRGVQARTQGLETGANNFARAITQAFAGSITGGKQFDDVLKSLALRLSDMSLKMALGPLTAGLAGGIQDLFAGLFGASPVAAGGALGTPNYFPPVAGEQGFAGEAGLQAGSPLTRGSNGGPGASAGASAAPGNVAIHIATPDAESFRRSEAYITGQIARAVARGQRSL